MVQIYLLENALHHDHIVCMIASANFTVQKQKLITQCRIQREDLNIDLVLFRSTLII